MEARERLESEEMAAEAAEKRCGTATYLDSEKIYRDHKWYWRGRRAQDIILSLMALFVLLPFMLLIALIVWIDSPGASPIFMQTRVGRNGRTFRLAKFRTMVPNAEEKLDELMSMNEMDGPVFKIKEDPRITRAGRFLRKSSLDELPQLINILMGDMSIVGPRPALPREVEQYDAYERQRLIVRPGLTCYWQIQPRRNELSFEQWMELDLKYIQEASFCTDWEIIFRTVSVVLRLQGV